MRWADQDLLGHVNNVAYVDYLQEARVHLLRAHGPAVHRGEEAEGVVVVRHEIRHLAPLRFRAPTVSIETWVTEVRAASFTVAYEVFHETDEGRTVYVRASTVLAPFVFGSQRPRRLTVAERAGLERLLEPEERAPRHRPPEARHEKVGHYPVQVRFSDLDPYGHVNNVTYAEYFQEARIRLLARLLRGLDRESIGNVVAQVDLDYRAQMRYRAEPYDAWSWVSHVGERSLVVESEICDGDVVLARARAAMVFFDPATQRAAPPPEEVRARLTASCSP